MAASRGPVVRLEPAPGRAAELEQALALMARVLNRRPELRRDAPRPRHRLLSELELALTARNEERADELVAELERLGSLSSINLLFLRIRCLDAAGGHPALLAHPSLPDLLRRRRPRAVSDAIAHAVEAVHVAPHQGRWVAGDRNAASAAVEEMSGLDASFGAVLGAPGLDNDHEAAAAAVVHQLLSGDLERATAATTRWQGDPYGDWLRALVAAHTRKASPDEPQQTSVEAPSALQPPATGISVEPAPPTEPPPDVDVFFAAGRYADALASVVEREEPSVEDVAFAVRSAYNLDTLEAAGQALALLDGASEAVQRIARQDRMVREAEQQMRRLLQGPEPSADGAPQRRMTCFAEWFEAAAKQPTWEQALEVADRGRQEWSHVELASTAGVERLRSAIQECVVDESVHALALGGLAHLLTWLEDAPSNESVDLRRLLTACFDLLIYAADASESRDDVSVRLLSDLLGEGIDASELDRLLADLGDRWLEVAAPRRLDWPIGVLDVAIDHAGRAPAVERYFGSVLASAAQWPDRVDEAQREALRSIAADLGTGDAFAAALGDAVEDAAEVSGFAGLAGLVVGIYTLTPGVGQRVERVLNATTDIAEIVVNSDYVSTNALVALARRADVMVVVKRSAKHAATDAIFRERSPGSTIVPPGKGSSAVLRSLEQWAADRLSLAA